MKLKFKIGDRVRLVRYANYEYHRGHSYPIGSIHIIRNVQNDYGVTFLNGKGWWYHFDELEFADNALQRLKERYEKKV